MQGPKCVRRRSCLCPNRNRNRNNASQDRLLGLLKTTLRRTNSRHGLLTIHRYLLAALPRQMISLISPGRVHPLQNQPREDAYDRALPQRLALLIPVLGRNPKPLLLKRSAHDLWNLLQHVLRRLWRCRSYSLRLGPHPPSTLFLVLKEKNLIYRHRHVPQKHQVLNSPSLANVTLLDPAYPVTTRKIFRPHMTQSFHLLNPSEWARPKRLRSDHL